jgi:thiamine-monophosphate kinase
LAAMAARPEAIVVAVALPRHGGEAVGRGLHEGLAALAGEHGVVLAGGDTNAWDGPLVVSVTALGSVAPGRAWRRDGARVGDRLLVTGACGGSLLGRHLAVTPRCREALRLAERHDVHAAIDVSDGLSLDVSRLMAASGTAASLDLGAIPIHADAVAASRRDGDGRSPLDHALGDGEDFELVLAMPAAAAAAALADDTLGVSLTDIGEVVAGAGLFARQSDGSTIPLVPHGYVHHFEG